SEAAIRAGAGYATVAVPRELEHIFEVKLTEVMSRGYPGADGSLGPESVDEIRSAAERAAAVALGPGLGRREGALGRARLLAPGIEGPLLIDADGLNAHAGRLELLARREAPTVITPHAGELARLLEIGSDEVEARRLRSASQASERSGAIVVLKGDDTLVVHLDRVAINRGETGGLARGGAGT